VHRSRKSKNRSFDEHAPSHHARPIIANLMSRRSYSLTGVAVASLSGSQRLEMIEYVSPGSRLKTCRKRHRDHQAWVGGPLNSLLVHRPLCRNRVRRSRLPHLKPAAAEVFPESVEENEQPGVVNCRVSLLRRVSFRPAKTVLPAPLQQQRFSLASLAKTSVAARLRSHKTVWPENCTLNFTFYPPRKLAAARDPVQLRCGMGSQSSYFRSISCQLAVMQPHTKSSE